MRRIFIEKMKVYGFHGCLDTEIMYGQYFFISLELSIQNGGFNTVSDEITHTIDYRRVCERVEAIVSIERFNLLESLAEKIARDLLLNFSELIGVKATVEKPGAPLDFTFQTLGVTVERTWHTAYLSIGSNLGDRENNINKARKRLDACSECAVTGCSKIIETAPWGRADQPPFLNSALAIKTFLEPPELLNITKNIELKTGRERGEKWSPRIIDIDILLYDLLILTSEDLRIPHPYMCERAFALEPLAEIAPDAVHPLRNRTIRELLNDLQTFKQSQT